MKENPLLKVQEFGQSIWMDYLSRQVIASGELVRFVKEDGLRGVTSIRRFSIKPLGAVMTMMTSSIHFPGKG